MAAQSTSAFLVMTSRLRLPSGAAVDDEPFCVFFNVLFLPFWRARVDDFGLLFSLTVTNLLPFLFPFSGCLSHSGFVHSQLLQCSVKQEFDLLVGRSMFLFGEVSNSCFQASGDSDK